MDDLTMKLYLVRAKDTDQWYLYTDQSRAKQGLECQSNSNMCGYASSLCGDAEEALGIDKFRKHTRYAEMDVQITEMANIQCPTCDKISDA